MPSSDAGGDGDAAAATTDAKGLMAKAWRFCKRHPRQLALICGWMALLWLTCLYDGIVGAPMPGTLDSRALYWLGILPNRAWPGLVGIVMHPIVAHWVAQAASDSLGVLIMASFLLFSRGFREFFAVTAAVVLWEGSWVWLVARQASNGVHLSHVGAGGVTIAMWVYMLLLPVFERPFVWRSFFISLAAGVVYGFVMFGLLASAGGADSSWELALFGGIGGALAVVGYYYVWKRHLRERCTCCRRFGVFYDTGDGGADDGVGGGVDGEARSDAATRGKRLQSVTDDESWATEVDAGRGSMFDRLRRGGGAGAARRGGKAADGKQQKKGGGGGGGGDDDDDDNPFAMPDDFSMPAADNEGAAAAAGTATAVSVDDDPDAAWLQHLEDGSSRT